MDLSTEAGQSVVCRDWLARGVRSALRGDAHSSRNIAEFLCYLLVALLASRLKINMAEITDTMSVNFLFILIGVLQLSFTETLALGCVAILAQSFFGQRQDPSKSHSICVPARYPLRLPMRL